LEWLLAYENQLEELPPFGPRNWRLTRLLLESNPLRPVAVQSLVSDLSRSYIKTLGLDSNQVAVPELPDPLPAAVSVGTVIPISGQSQLSLKLTKASRLRRSTDRAESDHPELLIVAFAASQGEPEWLGFLRRLYEVGEVKPCCHRSSLDFAEEADFDARMARLWTHCTQEASTEAPPEETPALPLGDFDVLTVVDHRMRWYAEDRGALQQVLKTLRPKYQKMMCVGASMGGFGALLHGGLVADAVVAFNPQATLTEALLRPPAETPQELEDLSNAVMESVRVALARKAQMIVHCAADEHLMHVRGSPRTRGACGVELRPGYRLFGVTSECEELENGYKALDAFLKHTGSTKSNTRVLFRKYATGRDHEGKPALTLPQARQMIAALVQKLELPDSFFYDLDLQFSQFDFDGDGSLNAEETSCMVKSVLKERRSSAGGKPEDVDVDLLVPYRTLQDGGYVVVRELGRGGQGVMYLGKKEPQSNWLVCRQSDDDTEYCIKFYYKKDSNAGSIHEVVDEFSRMKEFDNEHVARTYETFQDQDFYYLVNEPYFGGDWTKLACKAYESNVHMTEDWWRHLYYQCVEGLDYLHKKAQMHCDIKEPNLMIKFAHDFRRPQVVYIDFGLSQAFARKVENITGTPGYIPPETWDEKAWYPNGDIFSLGVVFFQMLSGRVPSDDGSVRGIFQEANDFSQLAMLTKTAPPPWQIFPRWGQLQQMVAKMLDKRKENRPRAAALLHDPWFSSTSSSALPAENLSQIVRKSKEALCRSELVNEMCERCNLQELRSMQARLDQLRQFGQAAPAIPSVSTAKCRGGWDFGVLLLGVDRR
ncbi:Probable serine/threonine-protein kinase MARK-A, partial [Durusdinium trenchii]